MKITDAFLGEHGVLYALFNHLEQTVPIAESLSLVKSQGAMLAAALASHAQLEEELLFSTLEPIIGSTGPLAVMRMEHEQVEQAVESLPAVQELEEAQTLILQLITVARNHFAKEEQILFPLAAQSLSAETLTELGERWAAARAVAVL